MQQAMKRLRKKIRPATFTSLVELGPNLLTYEKIGDIYIGPVTSDDGSTALLFSSEKLMRQLDKENEIFIDGTFDVCIIYIDVCPFGTNGLIYMSTFSIKFETI